MQTLTEPAVLRRGPDSPSATSSRNGCSTANGGAQPAHLFSLFAGLSPHLMCHYGDSSGLRTILASMKDERIWANIRSDSEAIFRQFYRPDNAVHMRRMCLDRRVAGIGDAARLFSSDRLEIEDLLKQGEWVLFLPHALAVGHYYGIRENGRLVAMAGTHVASSRYDIA